MLEAKTRTEHHLKEAIKIVREYFTKDEIISLVEEAYKPKGKTLEEWLTEANMPLPVIQKAMVYAFNNKTITHCRLSLRSSLLESFSWNSTPEGASYWRDISLGKIPTLTVKDWIDTLPPDIREKAIGNTPPVRLELNAKSLWHALDAAFIWIRSKEGREYWCQIAHGGK